MTTLMPKFQQTGATTNRPIEDKLRESVSVKDFGAVGNGIADDTVAIQAAIDAAQGTQQLFFPAGTYKVTSTLNLFKGSNLVGINKSQGYWEYSAGFVSTKILFLPTVESDLFTIQNLPLPVQDFRGHVSVGGMYIQGDSNGTPGFSRRAFNLDLCIYGHFYDLEIIYFWSAFLCQDTINNKFSNVRIALCTTSCVEYSGTAPPTTDVWTQCTFSNSPLGVRFSTGGIAVRFSSCLWETLEFEGIVAGAECRDIEVISCYSENVPSTNDPSRAFARIGFGGGVTSNDTVISFVGGSFAGRNAGAVGAFLDADDVRGVQLTGVRVKRFTNVIRTTVNTTVFAIACSGVQWVQCTTYANDTTKLSGNIDFQAVNAGTGPVGFFAGVATGNFQFKAGLPVSTGTATNQLMTDYEEGTWVPTLFGSTSGSATTAVSGASGSYTKIGRLVLVSFDLEISNVSTALGNVQIGELPFASGTTGFTNTGGNISILNALSGGACHSSSLLLTSNSTRIIVNIQTTSTPTNQYSALPVASITSSFRVAGTISYNV
jgi:hypothetical protein